MTVYYPKHTDSLTLDYTIGTCLILIFLVSTTLNPLSFLYHIQRDSKLSSRLYALLAIFDFLVNVYSLPFQAHNFFKVAVDTDEEVKIQARVAQGSSHIAAWCSQLVINVILFVRLYTIKFPFSRVNRKAVWICLVYTFLHVTAVESVKNTEAHYWDPELQFLNTPREEAIHNTMDMIFLILILLPLTVIYILGGMSAIYTAFLLTRDTGPSETREQKRKSVRIVLTLSVFNWSVPIAMIYTLVNWPNESSTAAELVRTFAVVNGMSKIVSLMDPVIILVLSKDLRVYVKDCVSKCFLKIRSAVGATFAKRKVGDTQP